MRDLTIQILTKNNEKTIKATLESILPLNARVFIIDCGSTDGTFKISQYYGCEVIKYTEKDYSKARNTLVKESSTNWHFVINPNETLSYGAKEIKEIVDKNKIGIYFLKIFNQDILTKEIRLWHKDAKLEFVNPVYECLVSSEMKDSNAILYSKPMNIHDEMLQLVRNWKKDSPVSSSPHYYEACLLLSQGKYDEFIKAADLYLFKDKEKIMPITMMRYYCAWVYCHVKKNPDFASRNILPCIVANPLMAEFWCLLGDIYYLFVKDYNKAIGFYDNAIFLGGKRLNDDPWPMEIKKYKDYPQDMKKSCLMKIKKTVFYGARSS